MLDLSIIVTSLNGANTNPRKGFAMRHAIA
jgi:hypothetical protein